MKWHPELETSFQLMWSDYVSFNPHALKIYDDILAHEKAKDPSIRQLVNDHIALRTIDLSPLELDRLGQFFVERGYKAKGEYQFKEKKLFARHYEHEDSARPKVFISHLLTNEFSKSLQATCRSIAELYVPSEIQKPGFFSSGRKWEVKQSMYRELLKESEYAAWFYAFGFRCNHFTISVNHLKSFAGLTDLNTFVLGKGHKLNTSGGVIKGAPSELLEQSSTLAGEVEFDFSDGKEKIPACYYEFAKRHKHPKTGLLYTGFIAASADRIFESTNRSH